MYYHAWLILANWTNWINLIIYIIIIIFIFYHNLPKEGWIKGKLECTTHTIFWTSVHINMVQHVWINNWVSSNYVIFLVTWKIEQLAPIGRVLDRYSCSWYQESCRSNSWKFIESSWVVFIILVWPSFVHWGVTSARRSTIERTQIFCCLCKKLLNQTLFPS